LLIIISIELKNLLQKQATRYKNDQAKLFDQLSEKEPDITLMFCIYAIDLI